MSNIATDAHETALTDWAGPEPSWQTAAVSGLARALQRYENAKADAERTHGIEARRVLAIEHKALIDALAACPSAGRA